MEEPNKWWEANLSTGWDSLYMFRGVNLLRNGQSYGSSIYWTEADVTFNLTENDFLTVGAWFGVGIGGNVNYQELDAYVSYTRTFGSLSLYGGYILYTVWESGAATYSHELNVGASYQFEVGFVTLIPSITYYFNLGPGLDNGGFAPVAGSYLDLRLDLEMPLIGETVFLAPWIAYGTNFRYNANNDENFFNGANNLEFGLGVPIQLTEIITLYGYGAYSIAFKDLIDTRPNTFWGGASIQFSF
jgi:hypothetical protein